MLSRWARWHGKRKFLLFYCICRTLCQEQNNERSWEKKTLSFFSWMKTPTPHTLRSIWLVVNDWMISNNEIQGKNKNSKSVFVFHLPGECSYQITEIPFHFFFSFFKENFETKLRTKLLVWRITEYVEESACYRDFVFGSRWEPSSFCWNNFNWTNRSSFFRDLSET